MLPPRKTSEESYQSTNIWNLIKVERQIPSVSVKSEKKEVVKEAREKQELFDREIKI